MRNTFKHRLAPPRATSYIATPLLGKAFGISGDRTQHLLWRVGNGELQFRHTPEVVVICIGTNNVGRDGDSAEDTFLGILAVVNEVLHRLPGAHVLLPGILPRGPGAGDADAQGSGMLPGAPGVSASYSSYEPTPSGTSMSANSKFAQPGLFTPTIVEVNRRLKEHAESCGGSITFVECTSIFCGADGNLVPSLMRDALHPTAKGMQAWYAELAPAVSKLLVAPRAKL